MEIAALDLQRDRVFGVPLGELDLDAMVLARDHHPLALGPPSPPSRQPRERRPPGQGARFDGPRQGGQDLGQMAEPALGMPVGDGQLSGVEPAPERARALETYLNTVCDHGLNASTFTPRVIIATRSDVISAITGAVGALKGPLHGGAPGPALDMVFEIATAERAEAFIRAKLDRGERIMGFGLQLIELHLVAVPSATSGDGSAGQGSPPVG